MNRKKIVIFLSFHIVIVTQLFAGNSYVSSYYNFNQESIEIDTFVAFSNNFKVILSFTDSSVLSVIPIKLSEITRTINTNEFYTWREELIVWLENHGYPFSKIWIDSISADSYIQRVYCTLDPRQLILMDTLYIRGDLKVNNQLLSRKLGIPKGSVFSQNEINRIDERAGIIPYLSVVKQTSLTFFEDKCVPWCYFNQHKSNYIDGLLGLSKSNTSNFYEITGTVNIQLTNSLKRGERISINWNKYGNESQKLNTAFNFPYLFNTPIGFENTFLIKKQDSSYINLNLEPSVYFELDHFGTLMFYYRVFNSIQIIKNSNLIIPDKINTQSLGIRYKSKNDFNEYLAIKGWFVSGSYSIGSKKISDPDISSINTSVTSMEATNEFIGLISLNRWFWIYTKAQMGIKSGSPMFENELFRLGGTNSIRGIREESIFSDRYLILTGELRFQLETNTDFHLFSDLGFYKNTISTPKVSDSPLGGGIGFRFALPTAVLSLDYAIARQFNNQASLQGGLIHIRLISNF